MNIIPNYGMTNYQTNFRGNKLSLKGVVQKIELCEKNNDVAGAKRYAEQLGTSALNVLRGIINFHY